MTQLHIIEECTSTNSAIDRSAPHGFALMARRQTAGRGQRGNSWESAPEANITLSMMIRPQGLEARRQFEVSEAVALGITDLLDSLGLHDVAVKWPNDIYVADHKICGILIENTIQAGLITRSIAGIGLNVNQRQFLSSAPNPISLFRLTGREHDVETLAQRMIDLIDLRLQRTDNHTTYRRRLWRGQGIWPWLITATGQTVYAAIDSVDPDGSLRLHGLPTPFPFKSISPL